MVSNSKNKIHQTWGPPIIGALYTKSVPNFELSTFCFASYLFDGPRSEGVTAAAAPPSRVVVEGIDREDAVVAAIKALDGADEGPAFRGVRATLAHAVEMPVGL